MHSIPTCLIRLCTVIEHCWKKPIFAQLNPLGYINMGFWHLCWFFFSFLDWLLPRELCFIVAFLAARVVQILFYLLFLRHRSSLNVYTRYIALEHFHNSKWIQVQFKFHRSWWSLALVPGFVDIFIGSKENGLSYCSRLVSFDGYI